MAKLLYGTHWIMEDEPCLALFEMDLQSPGNKGFHRYQIVYVMRDEKPAEFRMDLGKSTNFKHDQIRIPGGAYDEVEDKYYVEHTVGELRDMVLQLRNHPSWNKEDFEQVPRQGANLLRGYYEKEELRKKCLTK